MSCFVVVTGLPASGKSTVGRAIATGLGLSLLDKDEFLESLFQSTKPSDANERRKLSRLADDAFRVRALASAGAVLASWWRHPRSSSESGTPTHWLPSGPLVEVHCSCTPVVAVERFLARTRHPGHLDGQRSYSQLLAQFIQQASLGPLSVGSLIQVNTNEAVNTQAILRQVNQVLEASHHVQPAA